MILEQLELLMRQYKEGVLTKSELESFIGNSEINEVLDEIEEHGEIYTISSVCERETPPEKKMTIEVTREGHRFMMKKI